MRRGLHHGISLETSVSDFSGRRQARSVVGDRRRRRNLHFGIVQRPAIRHAAQGPQERRQIGQARNFRRTDSRSRGTRPWWCDHGCGAPETEPRVDYSGAWRYRHGSQRILLRRWHRDRCLRPQGWHPNPHPANARQAQPASTRFPHQQRQCLPQPPQGMAASLPWRRDEEPAQLPWLAPYSGGLGPKDHARGFYLWSDRIRPISTINAIRAIVFLGRDERLVQDQANQIRRCRLMKLGDEVACRFKPGLTLRLAADIGGLQREIDPPRRTVSLVRRHDLLAEQEPRLGGQLDTGSGAEADRGAVDDHDFALAQLQNQIRHRVPSVEQKKYVTAAALTSIVMVGGPFRGSAEHRVMFT